ncbi:MAG: redoxin domain-containing protein [Deltaproteobacteria bacterium]|nr:redoxin domain-containing protein [Deltaproteobacteria bacterium]
MKAQAALMLGLLLAGCDGGGDGGGGGTDTGAPADDASGGEGVAVLPQDYPAPPHGKTVGAVIENHTFLIPGDPPTEVRLSDYYQHETKKILLINASAGWCGACKQEAGEMNDIFLANKARGFDLLYTLFEDWNGGPVNQDFYEGWVSQYGGDYTTVLDPEFELGAYFNVESTPMNMLVDLSTMTIVWLKTGFDPIVLQAKLDELLP